MPAIARHLSSRPGRRLIRPQQRFVLGDVDGESYELLSKALEERPIRSTYDQCMLELMMPSAEHERLNSSDSWPRGIARMI